MCRDSNRYRVDNGDSSDTGQVSPVELCGSGDRVRVLHCVTLHCTVGEEGVIVGIKNHLFCRLKELQIFFLNKYFPMTPCSEKASPTVHSVVCYTAVV